MTSAELLSLAQMVRRKFAKTEVRYGYQNAGDDTVCDLQDVEQDAALAIWEHYMATKLGLAGRRSLDPGRLRDQAVGLAGLVHAGAGRGLA